MIPEFTPAEDSNQRAYGGWIILFILFAFLITSVVSGTFRRQANTPKPYEQEQQALNQSVRMKETMKQFIDLPSMDKGTTMKSFSAVAEDLKTQPKAPQFLAVAEHELGQKLDPAVAAQLKKNHSKEDNLLLMLYSSSKLTKSQGDTIIKELPPTMFIYRLALVHAREKAGMTPSGRQDFVNPVKVVGFVGISMLLVLIGIAGFVLWVVFFSLKKANKISPKGLPTAPMTARDADRLAWKAAILISTFFLLSELTAASGLAGRTPLANLIPPFSILALLWLLNRVSILGRPVTLSYQGLNRTDLRRHILLGLAGFCAELPITLALFALGTSLLKGLPTPTHPASEALLNNPNALLIFVVGFGASVSAPIWEEIMFRGSLFPSLSRYLGVAPAALFSSFLFASIHPQGIPGWAGLGAMATVSCLLVYYTKSLVPSITMHMIHNTMILIFALTAS
ncbi:hypothetical protein BH11ARM1_BH11ARM1_05690 [soil metagenome]